MGHGQNIFTALCCCSHTTPPPASVHNDGEPAADAAGNGLLSITMHCQYPSIPSDAAHDGFAVMVRVKAPTLVGGESSAARAPLDLVAVVDVSASMAGPTKLEEAKRAMALVVDALGPRDRLCVVAFSGASSPSRACRRTQGRRHARRGVPLRRRGRLVDDDQHPGRSRRGG
jgi:hypothetical protein